ncbi:MAG: nucleotidyltransferase domain-containing protein [Solirubrobacterales bacterium]
MDIAHPYTTICPTLDSGALSLLAGTKRPLTGREIARLLDRPSHSGVLDALNRLTEHGLVDRQEAGRAFLFTLNREHLAAPAAEVLAGMRNELISRLRVAIDSWSVAPMHVSLFGSAARGEGDAQSDIDLFIVRAEGVGEKDERWRAQLDLLAKQVQRWTGNRGAIAEIAEAELSRLRADGPPIVDELRSDAITLAGPAITAVLGPA